MAVLKYKDPQGNWQTLDTGSGSVSSVEITSLPYGSEPTARISAGVLYIGWPDGVPVDSVITDESDNPVTSAAIYQALQDTPGMAPVQSVNNKTGAVVLDAQDVGAYEKPASGIPASDLAAGVIPAVPVQDVTVNGTSVLNQGMANIPVAGDGSGSAYGVTRYIADYGVSQYQGYAAIGAATDTNIKNGTNIWKPIVPARQNASTFYGLAKAAGADMASSSNPVGQYTDAAKIAIQKMLGIYEAPWELIREDTFTNATEADHIITVDGNGEAFELTDVVLLFETPVQETPASKGNYGTVYFYNGSTGVCTTLSNAWTQAANAAAHGFAVVIEQDGHLLKTSNSGNTTSTNNGTVYNRYREGFTAPIQSVRYTETPVVITKVSISAVTGTGHYILIGKRKWQ